MSRGEFAGFEYPPRYVVQISEYRYGGRPAAGALAAELDYFAACQFDLDSILRPSRLTQKTAGRQRLGPDGCDYAVLRLRRAGDQFVAVGSARDGVNASGRNILGGQPSPK